MSSLTIATARDQILGLVHSAWTAAYPTAPMLYSDVDGEPPLVGLWARATVHHAAGGQAALSGGMWNRSGVVTVQIFSEAGRGFNSDAATQVIVDALEGNATSGNVWFTKVRLNEIGRSGKWQQTNVSASFEYYQRK